MSMFSCKVDCITNEMCKAVFETLIKGGMKLYCISPPEHQKLRHLYIRTTSDYDLWSIGIYTGTSPLRLHAAPSTVNPVLTRDDIDDVPAELIADPFRIQHEERWFH